MSTVTPETAPADSLDLEPTPPEVKHYNRLKLWAGLASLALSLTFLTLMALVAGPALDRAVRGAIGDNRWFRLVALAFIYGVGFEVLSLPLAFWTGYVLEHRHQLSNQTLGAWIWQQIKGYLVGGPLGLGLLGGLYAVIWFSGPWWWLWATLAWLGVTLVLGQLAPVLILPLFYKVTRLDDAVLLERLRRLAHGTGLQVEGIYRLHLSEETRKANAALTGLGHTRRVLLGDTLLDNFTEEEIEVVFAHEVGHHVFRHIPKLVIGNVVLSAAGFWLIDRILRDAAPALGYVSFDDPAALPLLMLVPTVLGLLLAPMLNGVSRYFERQCDRYALERTSQPLAYRSAFVKLARMNKADADPHPVKVWLFDDHPPIRQRLAVAKPAS